MCAACGKIKHFKGVYRGSKSKKLHSIDLQEEQHHNKGDIDKVNMNSVNINSITFNSKHSVITANLNTSLISQATLVVGLGSDGNIMLFHIFTKLFPKSTKEELAAIKNESIKLRTYNSTIVTQLGRCTVESKTITE